MTSSTDSFLTGANATYIAELYARYLKDAGSADASWLDFFAGLGDGQAVASDFRGASFAPSESRVIGAGQALAPRLSAPAPASASEGRRAAMDSIRALMMIRTYRVRGHLIANLDPLGLEGQDSHVELDPKTYGFGEEDMDRQIFIDNAFGLETASLREILRKLKETYCGSIGAEFMHIQEPAERDWIIKRIENINEYAPLSKAFRKSIFAQIAKAEGFEKFLNVKYPGTKRFGLDGGESLIPALESILQKSSQLGVREIVLGMPHRGRLNVLANVMHKPYAAMFSEFKGVSSKPDDVEGSGDVKYHLGTSADRTFEDGMIHLSLTANPSHLEAVNPVVVGKARAKQTLLGDEDRRQVMAILMHGDAAFAGQGLVPETLELSQLRGYRTGGTIHVIVNNQIGFTAKPSKSRSSPYPSDIAKGIQAPIFHVNGDDPEAVVRVAGIAAEFRHEFRRDAVIDLFCYRRHGHNEADEPMFTNPIMYNAIAKHPALTALQKQKLVNEGALTAKEAESIISDFQGRLEQAFKESDSYKPNKADWLEGKWKGIVQSTGEEETFEYDTSASMELLKEVGMAISNPPPSGFNANQKILRQLAAKRKMIESGAAIDWATAEALAFGTLLAEGTPVRLSGQDSGRGTFSHRHSVIIDQENEDRYFPLSNIRKGQAAFEVMDSPLSEAAVLGFEYGYSLSDPNTLAIWEAQFGDFANGAQVIIDQFIASGESKWLRMSSLVMLLPHGFEGQGPEHSSARLERYLQLCAENNLQVVNLTTPANYFHALRRQIKRNFRKPLIVMAPKSLLRNKLVVSKLGEMGPETKFMRVLPEKDILVLDKKVRRVVFCSGKVYYDLLQERRERGVKDAAIVRVEQLYPWPRRLTAQQLSRYRNAEVIWLQEEPANMGAWTFVMPRLNYIIGQIGHKAGHAVYVGRNAAASPAVGSAKLHQKEQAALAGQALSAPLDGIPQPFLPPVQKSQP